jgi:N-methylhydantoinase B
MLERVRPGPTSRRWPSTSSAPRPATTRAAIARLPDGRWRAEMALDGYECPVQLRGRRCTRPATGCRWTTPAASAASQRGINSPKCYTDAYTVFGLKCLIAPGCPTTPRSLAPFRGSGRAGQHRAPVAPQPGDRAPRHRPDAARPGLRLAWRWRWTARCRLNRPAASGCWRWAATPAQGAPFNVMSVGLGGTGARHNKDGLSTTAFPSGVGGIPVEVTEIAVPAGLLAQGIPARLGRCRPLARWPGPAHRDRCTRRRGLPLLGRHLRPPCQCRPRPPGRRGRCTGPGAGARCRWPGPAPRRQGRDRGCPAAAGCSVDLPGGGGFGDRRPPGIPPTRVARRSLRFRHAGRVKPRAHHPPASLEPSGALDDRQEKTHENAAPPPVVLLRRDGPGQPRGTAARAGPADYTGTHAHPGRLPTGRRDRRGGAHPGRQAARGC